MERHVQILILGAGCAGLTAGLYAARAGAETLILEQGLPGGQTALTAAIDNYPGLPGIDGASLMQRMEEQTKEVNRKAGEAYLAENAKREEVKVTASGLQYQVIKEGEGECPTKNDRVTVHYTGALIDGTVFDSSVERGEPATFGVTQVIPGWVEALQMMKPGAEWRLFIPSNLAYGPNGAGGLIGPNMTLIFDVQLIKVEKA